MKLNECPECGGRLRTVIASKRLNRQECLDYSYCCWQGEVFEPETRPIPGSVRYYPMLGSGWHFQIVDKYGQPFMSSRAYGQREDAVENLLGELNRYSNRDGGPLTAILFPPSVEVQGEIFTVENEQ